VSWKKLVKCGKMVVKDDELDESVLKKGTSNGRAVKRAL
jgi:hypothetical protein